MAFQAKPPFFAFLQGTAAGAAVEEAAPAENYILDERLPDGREYNFLAFNGFASTAFTTNTWFKQHVDYTKAHVALPPVSETFTAINKPNWLSLSPNWDVVRVETLCGLGGRAKSRGSDVDDSEAGGLIRAMLAAREAGSDLDPWKEARLEKWLRHANSGSDRRPAFVAPFAEVEEILNRPDWANRLRDALGLGHIRAAGPSMTVVLMQYNLVRVHDAHIGMPAWAASPTVLDDVPGQMPNPCFFPSPKKASADGYGFTVDLALTDAMWQLEFLHGHIAYALDDIRRIGEVTTDVAPAQISKARRDRRDLLASDLCHLPDLRPKP